VSLISLLDLTSLTHGNGHGLLLVLDDGAAFARVQLAFGELTHDEADLLLLGGCLLVHGDVSTRVNDTPSHPNLMGDGHLNGRQGVNRNEKAHARWAYFGDTAPRRTISPLVEHVNGIKLDALQTHTSLKR
jgi:hypothetical protein